MPTNRKKRSRVATLDQWKIDQLVTGQFLIGGVGYAELVPHGCNHWSADDWTRVRDAMRADWAIHGASLAGANGGEVWAAREFGAAQ